MLALGRHAEIYNSIRYTDSFEMTTTTVDDLLRQQGLELQRFDWLTVDTQGADLKVLKGSETLLRHVRVVYVEVSETPLYEGGATLAEIQEFLGHFGFSLQYLSWNRHKTGNALFRRA